MLKMIVQTFYFMMFVPPGSGGKLTLRWDKNPGEDDISGYMISCHLDQSGSLPPPEKFENVMDIPAESAELRIDDSHIRYQLKGLAESHYFWIAVRAYKLEEGCKRMNRDFLHVINRSSDNPECDNPGVQS